MNNIETMKMALEAMESAIKSGDWVVDGACDPDMAITALRQAIEQAQQAEPVAWIYEDELPEGYPYDATFEKSRVIDGVRMFPVNVAPPRQPLTDEQVEKIIKANMSLQMNLAGIREDFEAAHGIKGEA